MGSMEFRLILPEKISTNAIYAGKHWRFRSKVKDKFLEELYAEKLDKGLKPIKSYPVEISFMFFFTKRPLDASNCSFMGKMIEDAMTKVGLIEDDDYRRVRAVAYYTGKTDLKNDYVDVGVKKYNPIEAEVLDEVIGVNGRLYRLIDE